MTTCHAPIGRTVILVAIALCLALGLSGSAAVADEISFSGDVRPILAEYCVQCHGPDEQHRQADLRLDIEDDSTTAAIVPGDPDASEMILRLTSADPDMQMPPPEMQKRPTAREIEILRRWIDQGATFEGHWSYQPIRNPEVPEPKGAASTEIDRFIVAALEKNGLTLAPRLDRRRLIRRATFDLIGLPPSPAEVDAFVSDAAPDDQAFGKVIDRLLQSPRYGERWGRHWLDIARYADTHGGSAIGFTRFPFSYTYRDYVIGAFNEDLPYDEFILQQLAADQLDLPANDPALAALGFLTVGMQFRSVHDLIDDQIDVVTRGLMGVTVACARCHDHKFDEIPTTDYYALYATLAGSESPDELPVLGEPPLTDPLRDYQRQLEKRQTIYRDMARDQMEVMRNRLRSQVGLYLTELAKGVPEQDLSAAFLSYRTDDVRPDVLNRWRIYLRTLSEHDPVFFAWVRLQDTPADQFQAACERLVQTLKAENGDPAKFKDLHNMSVEAPKWNPRVLDALEESRPASLIELAEVYGKLFAEVHLGWLTALHQASLEATPTGDLITDEDPRHAEINSSINQQLRRHLYETGTPTDVPDKVAARLLNRTVSDKLSGKRGTIHNLHLNAPGSPPRGMVLAESETPLETRVFLRGNPTNRGERVEARFLTAVAPHNPLPFTDGQRRRGLAEAIVDPQNPLTRRVIVNWIWRHHFGVGLVRTPDDLGTRGTPPTHPQLLDHLATAFAEDGWSIKKMHRRIMLSDVYQQASLENTDARQRDAENRLLWRMPRKRLEMESMRDALLAVSGELDTTTMGGRPFDLETDPVVPRRSVYAFINRDIISSLSSTFDGADPTSCTVKRPATIVPQQTLYALNSAFIQDRAAAVAELAVDAAATNEDRVEWLYRRIYLRQPDQQERDLAITFVTRPRRQGGTSDEDATNDTTKVAAVAAAVAETDRWAQLAHAMLASNEFIFLD
ncbi:PSD1 and planctomycete cytochrome C domain-containing protein [Stieleria sp. ICT_E10.1]|uniref:PSD1 and planctomycete cytochrome C domain-containing protein n=1 Tax=Stieleria sedimenti TaxID=2976331 RepID=UPI00217F47CF|nr:PSD1 and planctomycete cytochrome C domain-containing protein [Stieleria sedimenti]MCS7470591.1 PSD1 and planctomycete cytochrome C domain-containing protein [Stieleria sedimenti]